MDEHEEAVTERQNGKSVKTSEKSKKKTEQKSRQYSPLALFQTQLLLFRNRCAALAPSSGCAASPAFGCRKKSSIKKKIE
jgi:hypothetical protein